MSDTKIAVVGLPRSGNRLVQRLLERHGFVAEVRHYGMRKPFRNGGEGADYAIWPIRDVDCWRKSCERDFAILPKPADRLREPTLDDLRKIHNERTLEYLAATRCEVLPVRYERIVAEPDAAAKMLLGFVWPDFVHYIGWGERIVDGNAKWGDEGGGPLGRPHPVPAWETPPEHPDGTPFNPPQGAEGRE